MSAGYEVRMMLKAAWRAGLALLLVCGSAASAGPLVVNANASDPAPRDAWKAVVSAFARENPDVEVKLNLYDHESYKNALRNWLTGSPPDVVFWFAGNRMRQFVAPGLLADVSDVFTPQAKSELSKSALDLVSADGRQYGVPYTYYQVGFYFRRDVLKRAGVDAAPADWPGLLKTCERLRAAGIDPFALGSKDLWPAAAWFDYLNLRSNGHDFHMALMNGSVPYTDARVRAVFERWRELLERDCFTRFHASLAWQESQSLLYKGSAAMMLIGNYIVPFFPPDVRDQMEFAPFPTVGENVGRFEDAPMNSLHVPARAKNPDDAKRFLAYVLRSDVQESLNKAILQIPVNSKAAVADDRFLRAGQDLLARADALAQFFDRDTKEDVALVAMKGFQEFMLNPQRLDAILGNIEQARRRVYKN